MTAEEIIKEIDELNGEEREKVFLGIMDGFNTEMATNDNFRNKALAVMQGFMAEKMAGGQDISEFKNIMKGWNLKTPPQQAAGDSTPGDQIHQVFSNIFLRVKNPFEDIVDIFEVVVKIEGTFHFIFWKH